MADFIKVLGGLLGGEVDSGGGGGVQTNKQIFIEGTARDGFKTNLYRRSFIPGECAKFFMMRRKVFRERANV